MIKNLLEKRKKMNNGGFTIVELLVATAILSIVVVIVYSFMMTSSRFYERTSADADIQMEAQLVANTISDLIIDCEVNIRYDESVSNQIPDAFNSGEGSGAVEEEGGEAADPAPAADDSGIKADPDDGKTLEIDNCDYQFLIINAEDDKLYYVERTADPTTGQYSGSFDLANAELLAENVTEFSVDLSRVKGKGQENIVTFSMTYKKGNRSYAGVYQVNLRNQVTVNEVVTETQERKTTIDKLVMSPDLYVTIKGKENPDLFVTADRNLNFNVSYKANNLTSLNNLFTWSMDSGYQYAFPDPAPTGAQATISLPDDYDLSSLPGSNFRVTVQSNIPNKAGENLTASAMVYFKKVQNVTVTPKMGIVNGEAATNSAVMLSGLVDGWNLDNAEKYVTWNLQYYTDKDKTLRECPENIATLSSSRTSAYVQIGDIKVDDLPEHQYHFVVTATSQFDTEWTGTYEFGLYTPPEPEYPDDACRGVEIDVLSYFKKYPGRDDVAEFLEFSKLEVENVSGWDATSKDLFVLQVVDGRLKLYVNYEDYKYQSVMQLIDYYEAAEVNFKADFTYLKKDGTTAFLSTNIKLQLEGTSIMANQGYADGSSIVVPYGGAVDVPFITTGYNITKKNQIGVYFNEQNVNANQYGMLDLNPYVSAEYRGALGTRQNLIKEGTVRILSKSSSPIRPVGSTDVKITVDDMYRLAGYMSIEMKNDQAKKEKAERALSNSHIGYKVYVANVEDANVYVPGPNEGAWTIVAGSDATVSCKDIAPSKIDATISAVTVNGNRVYQLNYAGNKYYYNTTYHYWQKQ